MPLKTKEAKEIVEALKKVVANAGKKPTVLQSDNGSEFKNEIVDKYLRQEGIKPVYSLAYTLTS